MHLDDDRTLMRVCMIIMLLSELAPTYPATRNQTCPVLINSLAIYMYVQPPLPLPKPGGQVHSWTGGQALLLEMLGVSRVHLHLFYLT